MPDDLPVTTPEDLARLIDGRADAEIEEGVKVLGTDRVLDAVLEGMVAAFLPDRARSESAVIQWDVRAPDGARSFQLVVGAGVCSWRRAGDQPARVTLAASLADFLRLVTGKLNGMQAFFQGRLKVTGDVLFAQAQEGWFQKPRA